MNYFLRLLSDSAYRKSLVFLSVNTLITRRSSFQNADASHVIPICACVYKRFFEVEANLVNVFSSLFVVQRVDNQVELLEKLEPKPFLLDLAKESFNFDVRILFFNLALECKRLWLVNVLSSEQKLPVEIADVNGV